MMQIVLWWYVYVMKHTDVDMTEYAIYLFLLVRYTYYCKKLDTVDMILVLVDHILLLRPLVSSFLLSVVSV